MKRLFYPLALGLLVAAGCSKDKNEPEAKPVLDGEYQVSNTLVAAPITMYTKDGPVSNQALIDRFLSRRTWAVSLFSRTNTPIPTTSSLAVVIKGNNRAYFISTAPGASRSDTLKTDITAQQAKYAVCTERDSISVLTSTNATGRCDVLTGQMQAELPVKRCVPLSMATGYSRQCRFRPVRVLKIDAGQLFIPQLSWLVQSGQTPYGTCGFASSGAWNVFNTGVLSQLTAGDTIVVQERTIALLKK